MSRGKPAASPLALRGMDGHLSWTRSKVTAWYRLAPQRWGFRAESECDALLTEQAQRWAQLAGRRVYLRVTTRPYPVETWAHSLDTNTPDPLPYWRHHLVEEQRHVLGLTLAEKEVYLGVELTGGATARRVPGMSRTPGADEPSRFRKQEADLREVDAIVAGPGLEGRPVEVADLEWLLHRSAGLGMPAPLTLPGLPGAWETEDLPEASDRMSWSVEPYGRTVRVVGDVDGRQLVRHVAVLTLGRMQPLRIPGGFEPWMQRTDRLQWPVEWSAAFDVLSTERVSKDMRNVMARIRSQLEHFAEHRLNPPTALARQEARALQIEDEVTAGNQLLAARAHGWARVAVSGDSEEQALERAKQVIDLYGPTVTLVRPFDQYRLAREFVPGEPLANTAYKRRLPVLTLAGAMPAATAVVGDRRGIHLGFTCGASERAVMWDTHDAMEVRERSGCSLLAGTLGSGKSTALGVIAYKSVLRGISTVVLDPSGPLARLCSLPELAPYSRAIDLMNADPGSLSPYRVVPEPRREHSESDDDWHRAQTLAAATRRRLCFDVLRMLLPASLDRMPQTQIVLRRAVRTVGGEMTRSPRDVLAALRDQSGELTEHAGYVADALEEVSESPEAQLIFPSSYMLDYERQDEPDPVLTVLTLRGLVLPKEGTDREDLSEEEQMSVPLLHLASWYTTRSIYGSGDMNARKLVALDETHELTRISSGRALMNKLARDSRKWNTRVFFSSQNVSDFFFSANVANLLDAVFIGRTEGADAQREALRVLRVPLDVGYEEVLAGLSHGARTDGPDDVASRSSVPREFVMADGAGGIEKIAIDKSGLPARVQEALDTTARPGRARPRRSSAVVEPRRPDRAAPVIDLTKVDVHEPEAVR